MGFNILGSGYYVPEKVVTNDDLSKLVETSDEWITQRVGIKERRVSENETVADMATKASLSALRKSGIKAEELDLIICATISSETFCPSSASNVQKNIGATCPAFDINSACSGFLFALDIANSYFMRPEINNVLVIGAERLSKLVDWKDRSTCVIFGDGAGAMVLGKGDSFIASTTHTTGDDKVLFIPTYSGESPFYKGESESPFIHMDGQETFKFAVKRIVKDIKTVAEKAGIGLDEIDYVIPHQANIRIIEYASKRLGVPMDKFFVNIRKLGNTSAASVPIAYAQLEESGKLKSGDVIAMAAFGGGLSSASCIIKIK